MGKNSVRINDPYLSWALKPGKSSNNPFIPGVELNINSYGFRDHEFERNKPPGTFRIFCMGDSTTFGLEVKSEETYPEVAEKILTHAISREKGLDNKISNFEILNAGTPGYSSLQGLVLLKRKILKYQPDMITLSYGFNDYTYREPGSEDKNFIGDLGLKNQVRYYLGKTMTYNFIKRLVVKKEKPLMPFGNEKPGKGGSHRVVLTDYLKNLEDIVRIAGENNIKVIFLSIANPYRMQMKELGNMLDLPFFDTTEFFRDKLDDIKENPEKYDLSKNDYNESVINSDTYHEIFTEEDMKVYHSGYFYFDAVHPNALGHSLIGKRIAGMILEECGLTNSSIR